RLKPNPTSGARDAASGAVESAFRRTVSGDVGVLYSANTAGAAAGAIAAGFWLIPAVGVRGTTLIGVALNALAAAGALWLARTATTINAETAAPAEKKTPKRARRLPSSPPQPGLAWSAAAVPGL